jgi:hypothetical protein
MAITVVTAFYPLSKSKHGLSNYKQWIANFCAIPCNLVVFTTEDMKPLIESARSRHPTKIYVRPFDTWHVTSPTMMEMWRQTHTLDPEKSIHSPELYAVWALKQEAVMEAIGTNATDFNSKWFIWCDIGIHRVASQTSWYKAFPSADVCSKWLVPGRMHFLEVGRISDALVSGWRASAPLKEPIPSLAVTVGGGCIAGDIEAWADFSGTYTRAISTLNAAGTFVGKDQTVFVTMLLNRWVQKPYRLFAALPFAGGRGCRWMSGPVILGGMLPFVVDERFEEK